jgi:hypothetical protein
VLSREQLAQLGVGRDVVRHEVRARRWRLLGRAVVLHRGPMTEGQRHWVAVLHLGDASALYGLTALTAQGFKGWERAEVHVVTPHGSRLRRLPWMEVHVSRRLEPPAIHPARRPSMCRVPRAAVDAASDLPNPRWACGLLAATVQQRLASAEQLRDELKRRIRARYRKVMRAAVEDIAGGAHALGELDLVSLCRRHGLPEPARQVVRTDVDGRRRYLDARFPRRGGGFVVVEVDGALHLRQDTWWEDQSRQNAITLNGDLVLRYPSVVLRLDGEAVVRDLRRVVDL